MSPNFENLSERLIVYYTGEKFREDVAEAKKEFFDDAGVVDEENVAFEMRMTQFLEWFLYSRKLKSVGLTPAQHALQEPQLGMKEEERPDFEKLANVRHSVFEFVRIRGDDIFIRDLFSNKKIVIRNSPISIGFSRDELFDARLIPDGEQFHFTKGFCFHPVEASKFILGEIKKIRKSDPVLHESLMLRLMKMRYKFEQYRHLRLEYVYTNDRKVRF